MGRLPSSMIFLAERPVSDSAGSEAATWCPYSFSIHLHQTGMHQAALLCVSSVQAMVQTRLWHQSEGARHALIPEGAAAAVYPEDCRRSHPYPRQSQTLKDKHGKPLYCNDRQASRAETALEETHPPASEPDLVGCSKTMAMWPVALVSTCTRTR